MKIDLTKKTKTLKGNPLISPDVSRSEIQEEYADEDGSIDVNDLPDEMHQKWGHVCEAAIVNFKPKDQKESLMINSLAVEIMGEDEAELNDSMVEMLIEVLDQFTAKKGDNIAQEQKVKWWVTTPIIQELKEE